MKRLLLAVLVFLPGVTRAADSTASQPAIKLSPYEVRANSVEFKHWIKIGSPNFILYTDARESEAATALREFEMLHFANQVLFGRKAARFGPIIVILPTASSDWRKLEAKGGAEEWRSAVTTISRSFVDAVVVQYDWQGEGLGTARSAFSMADMQRMEISGPFWFARSFGLFCATADFDGERVILGHVHPTVWRLKEGPWLPWGRFFEVNGSSPEFTKADKVEQYEAQATLFTQYLFTNSDRAWISRLVTWLDYLRTGAPPTEAEFKTVFGQDWKTWQKTMQSYLDGGEYHAFQVRTPAEVNHYTETKFKLPVKEMRELFILVQVLGQNIPESEASLDALLAAGLQSEPLRELLAEACMRWGRRDEALKCVRQLIAAGTTNPRIYRLGDALLTAHSGRFGLDCRMGPELGEVRAWDNRGVELEPYYSDLNNSMAVNEACAPEVDQQGITTIEACYARLKGRAPTDEVITALAVALWRTGDRQTAGELARRLSSDPRAEKRFRDIAGQLLERIQAETRSPAAATSG